MVDAYTKLFNSLKTIQNVKTRRKTFMDVSGYPHYENVVSNILAFLFDDSEEHGLQNLWLNALLSLAVGSETRRETHNIRVEREVYTEKGNRIDLLITSDDYIVCIENKIFSGVGNDLLDYKRTAEKNPGADGKELVCILLSLTPAEYKEKELFNNILYSELFSVVRAGVGDYIGECDNTWLIYMKDFISTIEALSGGNMINKEFEKLYQSFYNDIRNLDKAKDDYMLAIKEEVEREKQVFQDKWKEFQQRLLYPHIVTLWDTIYSTKYEMRASVIVDFDLDSKGENCVAVETSRDAWGWHIALHKRRGKNTAAFRKLFGATEIAHPANKTKLSELSSQSDNFYGGQHIVKNLATETSLETVAEEISNTIEMLVPLFKTCME